MATSHPAKPPARGIKPANTHRCHRHVMRRSKNHRRRGSVLFFGKGEAMESKLKGGIDALRAAAVRAGVINPSMAQWFEGYAKACDDIQRGVVDAAFKERPLPGHWRPNNERPE
jgi:hypothetical protein